MTVPGAPPRSRSRGSGTPSSDRTRLVVADPAGVPAYRGPIARRTIEIPAAGAVVRDRIDTVCSDAVRAADDGFVVLGAPGGTVELVAATLASWSSDVRAARRTDRDRPGAFTARSSGSTADGRVLVVDAQWVDDEALLRLADGATSGAGTIVVHRTGHEPAGLVELRRFARRSGRLVDVSVLDVDDLVAGGVDEELAADLVARTGGLPDLVAFAAAGSSLDDEVVARLALVGDGARTIAELVAFGLDVAELAAIDPDADPALPELDDHLAALSVEGLLAGDRMPAGVGDAVRAACQPARRRRVVELVVGDGPAGAGQDLAELLLAAGDRTEVAAGVYGDAAVALAGDDPARSLAFATAATAAGIDRLDVVVAAAVAHLGLGDVDAAVAALAGRDEPEAELVRACAWAALGDLASAADSLRRSTVPALGAWAALGDGRSPDDVTDIAVRSASGGDVAQELVRLIGDSWGDAPDVVTDLRRVARRARAEGVGPGWPVLPDLAAVEAAVRQDDLAAARRLVSGLDAGALHARGGVARAAWVEARLGHLDAAARTIDELADERCTPHDRLLLSAARCAAAVRDAEGSDLERAVAEAVLALDEAGGHLHDLEAIADIVAAAHRGRLDIGDVLARLERRVPDRLGEHAPRRLARIRLRVAMAGDDVDEVRGRARDVLEHEPSGSVWGRVAAALAEPDAAEENEVVELARSLAERDATYEAARLCGLVALATSDGELARRLLRESRVWRTTRRRLEAAPGVDRSVVELSEQEERVGRLVIDGHTHKQVGAALFISPKTVEHHVAHIRTKLGCANRAEMMTALREYLGEPG